MRHTLSLSAIGLAFALTGCGHGSSSSSAAATMTSYPIGGSVSGLVSGTVVLQDNGGDNLTISNDGSFAFPTFLQPGASYDVTVATQPADGVCSVNNGTGTANATVTSITVVCTLTSPPVSVWTWVGGADYANAPGVYGTQGAAAASSGPGARRQPVAWTDADGNFWLFGGYGVAATVGTFGMLDDLWEYSPSGGEWVWQAGSGTVGTTATYGTLGTPAPGNDPGAREGAARWANGSGLWLFGGDSLVGQSSEQFNDLWEYDTSSSSATWTWMGGSNTAGNAGSYGPPGMAEPDNLPPARTGAISWVDKGIFWLFGGAQLNANGTIGAVFNDLWSLDPTTGLWTWMGGSNTPNSAGVYGMQGTASTSNIPAARMGGNVWVDTNGNVWLFGGLGLNQSGVVVEYNDLWEYDPVSGAWNWVSGSDGSDAAGVYGTEGTGAAGNGPGARVAATSWTDSAGNFWLFGGRGYDSLGSPGNLNDLWEYNFGTGVWTWISGSSTVAAIGTYGSQGTPANNTTPGAREQGVGWLDSNGTLWLFGGFGLDASGEQDELNDLWQFTPNP